MRYDRQIKLDEVGVSGQEKLRNASVLIVGVGGLGCPAAQYLTGAGIGKIGLMDHDTISVSNLHRQVLYDENDLGKSKVLVAKEKLQRLNSEIELVAIEEALTIDNAEKLFSEYDLILDGTDNFETKYLINDACILAGKPWVYASIYKNEGQLSVFNYQNGPSYRCLFSKTTRQNVSCEATGVLGVVPGIFGMLQAMEALKIILGVGNVLSGKLKISNLLSGSEQILNIQKKPEEIEKVKKNGIMSVRMDCEMKDSDKKYLDVREEFEQPKVTAANVIHIPLGELQQRSNEIPEQEEVLVFCQSGKRSAKAVEMLQTDFGFQNLKNVEGGIKTIING
ncbi:molybdenum cofactor biosynthesis protein [Subsaximicrobium wynnwilliamsii]|uniref:Molybdopterin-synthase adenylyltransferase n=1 Tax=Subsaximicrobium wynnwilliamsii TaxID=291179 RepID=A0A5C6ZEP5_9FLAO|nr:HesA/MoeB/ThiF family protein [Subsaximicrobium wynnwilliamsii]TXD83169.1 molybdenum cofactor biosynthesis protein [Subsaximicrobium wynnwilliamsii]TXD88282.1 molybdenum cofactor biosynthesis protein [Subsaximicrobium wynnwilliamsii]TXE03003.1 molybdenum cofactor biosynthesis protein [Subsaximicrobium wynnwilliamsii]